MADQNPSPDLTDSDRAELERLRAEVAELEQQVHAPATRNRNGRWRTVVATLLIIFGAFFIPASIMAMWTTSEITDTNRYVDTIAPLANNPAIQDSVANTITNQIFTYVDVKNLTQQVFSQLGNRGILPPVVVNQLQSLAGPVSSGIENFIRSEVSKIVHSSIFGVAWINANRIAHQSLVDALAGKPNGDVVISSGKVSINMAALIETVKTALTAKGFGLASRIPTVQASFTIFQSKDLARAQQAYRWLKPFTYLLPILAVLFLVGGIYLAKSRRRATIGAGIAIFAAAGVLALSLVSIRTAYLNAVPTSVLSQDAAAVIFDTIFRYLKDGIRNTALIGLIVAIAAFLIGPASGCVAIRRWCVEGIAAMRHGVEKLGVHLAPVSDVLAPIARWLRVAAVIIAIIAFILWKYRTPGDVLWITFWLVLGLGVIQFFVTPAPKLDASDSNAAAVATA